MEVVVVVGTITEAACNSGEGHGDEMLAAEKGVGEGQRLVLEEMEGTLSV